MKNLTQDHPKSNYDINTINLVSLKEIFEGIPPPKKKKLTVEQLFRKFKSMQDTINESMTVREQLEMVLLHLEPSDKLHELEKLAMKLRKANNLVIENSRKEFAQKYPKVHENSRKYTK